MGHKKRNTAPRAKSSQPPPASPTAADPVAASIDGGANPKPPDLDSRKIAATPSSSHDSIKLECERALTALRRGNHTKALRLMKDLCSKHGSSPLLASIHRVMGDVCVVAASIINDTNSKERHLKNAKESVRKSVTLSPNSIEFSHFYANLLFETANEGKDYQEVVQECERALAIENPIDPAKETLQEESYQKIFSAEVRLAHVQNELRSLIEKSNNAYECCQNISKAEARVVQLQNELQSLINTAPGCHEKISTAEASIVHVQNEVWSLIQKFRSIPMRSTRDPIELTSVMTRWPNEIKKSTKTPEERRKEIEVRVAAALLLQQKSESPQCGNDGDDNNIDSNKGLDSGSGMGPRVGEERKSGNTRRNIHPAEIRDWFRSYWNSMNLDGKKKLLRVGISDLKAHFSKERSVSKVLNEALYFGKENKVWKYWLCCCCYEKFAYADSHRQHVMQEHMRTLLPKLHSILPHRAENEWAEMLLNCSWKPLDLKAAIKMLEEQSKFEAPTGKKKLGDNSNDCTQESKELEDVKCIDSDENQGRKKSFLYKSWPSTDDPKRAGLLESIHAIFQLLIKHNHLVSSHLSEVIRYAVEVLQGLDSGSQLLNSNMDQTPLCMCFLGAPDLEKILGFLQEIVREIYHSEERNIMGDSISGTQIVNTMEKITFTLDDLVLVLDECFLLFKLNSSSCDDAGNDDSSSAYSLPLCYEDDDVVLDSDALSSWIFTGPSNEELLASWSCARKEKAQKGMEILQLREKEFYDLKGLCKKKYERLNYKEALQAVTDLCGEESIKREHVVDHVPQSYDCVLRKRRERLIGSTILSHRVELDAISFVLTNAESTMVRQFGFEETYGGVTSHNLKSGEDDDWRTKDYLHKVDSCIEAAIRRQKDQASLELCRIDARIVRVINWMQQLEVKLDPASAHDFRTILVPLVKSYLRAHLEDLAERDTMKKFDADTEAFLTELALDSEKGFVGGGESSSHMHERMKDEKKSKENRRYKDSEATGGNGLHMIRDQTSEEISQISAHEGDDPDAEVFFAGTDVVLRQQEEEYKHRIKLEFEERKVEETLEYERQIENEAKQKHLAEQPVSSEKENDLSTLPIEIEKQEQLRVAKE